MKKQAKQASKQLLLACMGHAMRPMRQAPSRAGGRAVSSSHPSRALRRPPAHRQRQRQRQPGRPSIIRPLVPRNPSKNGWMLYAHSSCLSLPPSRHATDDSPRLMPLRASETLRPWRAVPLHPFPHTYSSSKLYTSCLLLCMYMDGCDYSLPLLCYMYCAVLCGA